VPRLNSKINPETISSQFIKFPPFFKLLLIQSNNFAVLCCVPHIIVLI